MPNNKKSNIWDAMRLQAEGKDVRILFDRLGGGFVGAVGAVLWGFVWSVLCLFVVLISISFLLAGLSGIFIEATGIIELITSIVFLVFVSVVGAGLSYMVLRGISNTIGYGWAGMLTGERPPCFRSRIENMIGSWIHLFVALTLTLLGFLWFQNGQMSAYVQFSMNGLFLVFSGIFFGVAPLIPRVFFLFKHKEDARRQSKHEDAILPTLFIILVIFGMSFALGVDEIARYKQSLKDEVFMAYGETYSFSTLHRDPKSKKVRLIMEPSESGTLVFQAYECDAVFIDAQGKTITTLPKSKLKELNIPTEEGDMRYWAFRVQEKDRITAEMTIDYCTAQYRLLREQRGEDE
jgi:hypothetical protein